jgi:hypothetical protein
MTESQWLVSSDPQEMQIQLVKLRKHGQRRTDLLCLACVRLVRHLIEDEGAKQAFAWLEEHPGERSRPFGRGHVRELFHEQALGLYDAHHRREMSVSGAAIHVAYDLWADWYSFAFPNLDDYFTDADAPYLGALREDPHAYLPAIMRDIFGNPFRPVTFSPSWRTDTALALARQMYESRDFGAMPILADALQDAGCDSDDVLSHCHDEKVTHVRGCWVVDLVLGKA